MKLYLSFHDYMLGILNAFMVIFNESSAKFSPLNALVKQVKSVVCILNQLGCFVD